MKIYTKTGDGGETGLIGGKRVSKASLRIAAYGNVDELNAVIGLCIAFLNQPQESNRLTELIGRLNKIQNDLHTVGADLANPAEDDELPRVRIDHVQQLEHWCDQLDSALPPLKQFVLPGGCHGAAQLHLARTVARRAERATIALAQQEKVNGHVVPYLNRLSDLMFLMARAANLDVGHEETHPSYETKR